MPVTKSALKSLKRDRARTKVNKQVRVKYRTALKETREKPTKKNLQAAWRCLDRAAKKKVIHKNKAASLKSRLSKLIKK
jgi:small subunit ribosomal protein S20